MTDAPRPSSAKASSSLRVWVVMGIENAYWHSVPFALSAQEQGEVQMWPLERTQKGEQTITLAGRQAGKPAAGEIGLVPMTLDRFGDRGRAAIVQ